MGEVLKFKSPLTEVSSIARGKLFAWAEKLGIDLHDRSTLYAVSQTAHLCTELVKRSESQQIASALVEEIGRLVQEAGQDEEFMQQWLPE